jgi:general secretion pathway protein C
MAMRLLSFVIWAVVAASAVFWLTRLLARSDAAPPHTVTANANVSASADLSRLLGSTRTAAAEPAAEPPVDARFKLIGVVAAR